MSDPLFHYVTKAADLQDAVAHLMSSEVIGVDIEGDSLFHYRDRVCLIQMTGNNVNFIFDPLLPVSLDRLAPLFENRANLKVFHGAEYDLFSLRRDFGFRVHSLFDTVLAARAAGLKAFSLQTLVSGYFNFELKKKYQKADWSKRPLSREQLEYACSDTQFLPGLYRILREAVEKKGRLDQIEEECRLLEAREWENKGDRDNAWKRIKGWGKIVPLARSVLRELSLARESVSERIDRPPFKVASNHDLLRIAMNRPHSREDLTALFPGPSHPVFRNGELWLRSVREGEAKGPLQIAPVRERGIVPSGAQEARFARLKKWRDAEALSEGVESSMVMTTEALRAASLAEIRSVDDLVRLGLMRNWQFRRYGQTVYARLTSVS